MGLIKSYTIEEGGLHPFLIRDSWQVAKLNYTDEQHISNLDCLKIHQKTDRAFALLKGKAVLIIMNGNDKKFNFKVTLMQKGASYNIPKNIGYAIAMEEGSEIFIVEKSNSHIEDVEGYYLNEGQLKAMGLKVSKEFKK